MPIDASIYGQIQTPQQQNPLMALGQAYQLRALKSQGDAAERSLDQENQLAAAFKGSVGADGSIDRNKLYSSAAAAGAGAKIPSLQKGFLEQDKAKADVEKSQLEATLSKFDIGARILATYDPAKPETWQGVIQQTNQFLGAEAAARLPQQPPSLQEIQLNQQRALSVKDQIAARHQELVLEETKRHNGSTEYITRQNSIDTNATSRANNAASVGASIYSANLTDARGREANAIGRVPAGYRQNPDGTLAFIPGGPADPAAAKKASPTEFQGKSATYGSRAQEADRLLTQLEGSYSPMGINYKNAVASTPMIGGIAEMTANSALSPATQKAEQAQRDFVNAVLRQESGAAIGKDEFQNAKRQYFPQPGDSDEVKAQKAANRKLVVQGFLNNAGNAPVAQSQQAAPSGGGFKILGVK